jgi:hypothetical protein
MPTYITLSRFTDQGVRNAKDSPKRAEAFKEMAKKHGATSRGSLDRLACINYRANALYDRPVISGVILPTGPGGE